MRKKVIRNSKIVLQTDRWGPQIFIQKEKEPEMQRHLEFLRRQFRKIVFEERLREVEIKK